MPKNLPYNELWKCILAIERASLSIRINSKVLDFSLFNIGASNNGEEMEHLWAVKAMSAQDRGGMDGCPLLAMTRGERMVRFLESERVVIEEEAQHVVKNLKF